MMFQFHKTTEPQRHGASRKKVVLYAPVSVWFVAALSGCADLPRDQHGATARIQESKILVAGISREGDKASSLEERERRLVEDVARRLGARVEWRSGNAHALLQDLQELKLPLVAASVPCDSPFAQHVGLSQPHLKNGPRRKDYCLAVAPGENRLLLLVDQVIAEEHRRGEAK